MVCPFWGNKQNVLEIIVFIWAGVAFMVAFLFLLMVALEKLWERTEAYYQAHYGKPQEQVYCILERTEAFYQV